MNQLAGRFSTVHGVLGSILSTEYTSTKYSGVSGRRIRSLRVILGYIEVQDQCRTHELVKKERRGRNEEAGETAQQFSTRGGLQPFITPVPGDQMPTSTLHRQQAYPWCACIHTSRSNIQTNKIHKSQN